MLVASILLALTGCVPTEQTGLRIDVGSGTCVRVAPGNELMITLRVSADDDRFAWEIVRFELMDAGGLRLAGVDVLDPAQSVDPMESPSARDVAKMERNLDVAWLGSALSATEDSTVFVLLDDSAGHLDADVQLRVFWGGGEPVYYQDVPLGSFADC